MLGAANYIKSVPFGDSTKMGLMGHSFGALQTNFIITHSNVFAAAISAAVTTNLLSAYLELVSIPFKMGEEFHSKMNWYESPFGQSAIGASLWERPDLYMKQTSVLFADRVSTPLLIMHNKRDDNNNFRQGVQLYMALRRLQKPCWLLQYDNSDHALFAQKDKVDFTIRSTQFFNHYLMGAPAPVWMTKGIPYKQKGVDNGFKLDRQGKCSENCATCLKGRLN
ncbi:MAG: hypothetical protein DI539_16570 [Flavobacterium psychrophilum]|nr:MAG: hypothetical protein DI539_16570 [Flavobacterium psychrophilum]